MSSTFKNKFQNGWNALLGQFGKLGEQRHMAALRDGFALLVPLIVAASVGVICMTFVFGCWDTTSTSILGWITWGIPNQVFEDTNGIVKFVPGSVASQISAIGTFVFYTIWKGIFSFLAIFSTLTISYSLSRIKNVKDPFISSLVGLGAFLILSYGNMDLFNSNGLLLSIIASIISIELYAQFEQNEKLQLKMPDGVPPAVGRSFSKLFPTMFTLVLMILLQAPFIIIHYFGTGFAVGDQFSFGGVISQAIQAPFLELASGNAGSYVIGFTFVVFGTILWFFGLHGQNILTGVFSPIMIAGLETNQKFKENGVGAPTFLADGTQDAFIFFGGTGTTLALVIVALFLAKKKAEREIIKFGAAPALFNINEPIMFGLPLVLNFTYVIPFVLSQATLFTTTWLAIEILRWVPPVIVKIPWTTPVLLGGFLATSSWQGIALAFFNLLVAMLIWAPFVLIANISAKKQGIELVKIDYKGGMKKIKEKFGKKPALESIELSENSNNDSIEKGDQ